MRPSERSWKTLELETDGPVLRVWLNRPERRNALNGTALEEIAECFGALQRDFDTRVVVLGGRGEAFSAGADRREPPGSARMARSSGAEPRERRWWAQIGRRACDAIQDCEALTVCRIHGYAIGGGLALAAACDFRLAADDAWVSLPEVDLGIPLTWGATPRLIHEVGAARARELILLCERLGAPEALLWGLLHRAVPAAELDATVADWAARLAAKPEVAVHMAKTQLRGYARRGVLGDAAELDGDLLLGASLADTSGLFRSE